jgi:hypothetical protein
MEQKDCSLPMLKQKTIESLHSLWQEQQTEEVHSTLRWLPATIAVQPEAQQMQKTTMALVMTVPDANH